MTLGEYAILLLSLGTFIGALCNGFDIFKVDLQQKEILTDQKEMISILKELISILREK